MIQPPSPHMSVRKQIADTPDLPVKLCSCTPDAFAVGEHAGGHCSHRCGFVGTSALAQSKSLLWRTAGGGYDSRLPDVEGSPWNPFLVCCRFKCLWRTRMQKEPFNCCFPPSLKTTTETSEFRGRRGGDLFFRDHARPNNTAVSSFPCAKSSALGLSRLLFAPLR